MSLPKSRRQYTFRFLFGGVFHSAIVLWAFLFQVMRDVKDAMCQAAVAKISNFLIQTGRPG